MSNLTIDLSRWQARSDCDAAKIAAHPWQPLVAKSIRGQIIRVFERQLVARGRRSLIGSY
jgi:hypothetical protein